MWLVRVRTKVYAWMVEKVRGKEAKTQKDKAEAALSQEKQFESYWMTRIFGILKNYIVQFLLPLAWRSVGESVLTQYFAFFFSWSTVKEGFIVHYPALRRSKVFMTFYPMIWPLWFFMNHQKRLLLEKHWPFVERAPKPIPSPAPVEASL